MKVLKYYIYIYIYINRAELLATRVEVGNNISSTLVANDSALFLYIQFFLPFSFVGGCILCISWVHSADCCTYLVFLVALTSYLLTCISFLSLYLVHLLVLLSWIKVQPPISENGSFTGVSYKEGNKWNRNAYQKCNSGKKGEEYGNVCI